MTPTNRPFRYAILGAAIGAAVTAVPVQAEMTIRFQDEPDKSVSVIMIKDGKVRIEDSDQQGERNITIYDSASEKVIVLVEEEKSYYEITEQGMRGQMGQLKDMQQQMKAQMEEQLRNLSPEERRMVEQQMAQFGMGMPGAPKYEPPKITTKRTGRSQSVAGVRCDTYETLTDGKKTHEACVANPGALKLSSGDHKTLLSMMEFMGRMADLAFESLGMASSGMALEFTREFKDGIPVQMKDMEDGTTTTMQNTSTRGIAADLFKVPAGYTRVDPM
ncbi:MAG: DUF4412 domain-containing protein [Chromatiales bacterium]|jgi:hypothetical protein|nr:DUF4412 domain-containing protein [Chromatiales bacterium]MDX9767939.1 DUF4412 domain-containing protein [Ectothiorhodospiraceae bacterium]